MKNTRWLLEGGILETKEKKVQLTINEYTDAIEIVVLEKSEGSVEWEEKLLYSICGEATQVSN